MITAAMTFGRNWIMPQDRLWKDWVSTSAQVLRNISGI
jgi:hypothetical protein